MTAQAECLVVDAEGGSAELVGGPEVDAVDLAMLWDGIEVNDAREQDQGQSRVSECPGKEAQATDTTLLTLPGQEGEPEVVITRFGGPAQGHAVPGEAGDQVGRAVHRELRGETRRIGERLRGRPRAVDHHAASRQAAHVDGDRTRVDADDPWHRG